MEQLKSKQLIDHIQPFDALRFPSEQACLWIWNPLEVPPHMGISVDNAYFSLKWNGKDEALNCSEMIQRIQRKNIPVLAVQLEANFSKDDCIKVFNYYDRTVPNSITCLAPIKDLLQLSSPTKLSELLDLLTENQQVKSVIGFNIPSNSIELPEYSLEEIHLHLQNRIG